MTKTEQCCCGSRDVKSLRTEILIRLLERGLTQSRVRIMYIIIISAVWMGGAGGFGDGLPVVSRVSL